MKKILVIMGPNLNMLGARERDIYGEETYESLKLQIETKAETIGLECEVYQSNWEGAIIDKLHLAKGEFDGVIINAGALSHYSLSIRDAIVAVRLPCIEVHMSNIYAREEFRQKSVLAGVCAGQITGFGKDVYFLAIKAIKGIM